MGSRSFSLLAAWRATRFPAPAGSSSVEAVYGARTLRADLDRARARQLPATTWLPSEAEIRERVVNLGRMLLAGVKEARSVLQSILVGSLVFEPVIGGPRDRCYEIRGDTRLGVVLSTSPEGVEPSLAT